MTHFTNSPKRRALRLVGAFSVVAAVAGVFATSALAGGYDVVAGNKLPTWCVPVATVGGLLLAVVLIGGVLLQQARMRRRRQAKAPLGH